jgi:hypothetical protein
MEMTDFHFYNLEIEPSICILSKLSFLIERVHRIGLPVRNHISCFHHAILNWKDHEDGDVGMDTIHSGSIYLVCILHNSVYQQLDQQDNLSLVHNNI